LIDIIYVSSYSQISLIGEVSVEKMPIQSSGFLKHIKNWTG
jgi:hypothetical protein